MLPDNQQPQSPAPQLPQPAAPNPAQPVVQQPVPQTPPTAMPVQPPLPPMSPMAPAPAKKKKTILWLMLAISGVVLLVIAAFAFVIIKKPKESTGNYSKLSTYTSIKPSEAGNYSFDYPTNMSIIKEETDRVTLEQKAKPDQLLKTQAGWESRVMFSAVAGEFEQLASKYEKSSLEGNNEVITYIANIHKKVLEQDGMNDVAMENREDLSKTDTGKIVYDYKYVDKNNVLIKGRRVTFLSDTSVVGLSMEAIDKIWDAHTPTWDDITDSFELQP